MKKGIGIAQIGCSFLATFFILFMQMFVKRIQVETRGLRTTIAEEGATVLANVFNNDPLLDQSLMALVIICGIALIVVSIIATVLAVLKFAADYVEPLRKISNSKLTLLAPLASFLLALVFMFVASDYPVGMVDGLDLYITNTPTIAFYVCIIMLLGSLVLDWYGSRKKNEE